MDRKTVIAVVLCVIFLIAYRPLLKWLGFGGYLEAPRPAPTAVDSTHRDTILAGPAPQVPSEPAAGGAPPVLAAAPAETEVQVPEQSITVETPLYRMAFTNRGARLLWVELKRYGSAHGVSSARGKTAHVHSGDVVPPGDRVLLAGGPLLALDLGSGAALRSLAKLTYATSESLDAAGAIRALTFTATTGGSPGAHIRQTYRIRPDQYAVDLEVEIAGVPDAWRVPDYSLTQRSWPLVTESNLVGDAHALKATSLVGTNLHREGAGGLVKGPRSFDGSVLWAAVQSRYFISALAVAHGPARGVISSAERGPLPPDLMARLPAGSKAEQEVAINSLLMGLPSASEPVQRFVLYVGPGEYQRLASLKLKLERGVDFGWTWILPFSTFLLRLLNWLFAVVRNYGVAIVLLATLVRVLLHPLNMVSMRSMRAMQKLQPEMERIKEKYKQDPQAMNAAVMALYKNNKVNPAGGCLPMLIQMPIFIGLYQVLFNAIELRQAPFVGWMQDLSAPDLLVSVGTLPVRLLPLLMMGSGFLSQKLTPTDPRQLPTMYLMNVMMLVFFYNLPSGLVLYWTVMNVLTALQQWLVLRQDGPAPVAVATPARERMPGPKGRRPTVRDRA